MFSFDTIKCVFLHARPIWLSIMANPLHFTSSSIPFEESLTYFWFPSVDGSNSQYIFIISGPPSLYLLHLPGKAGHDFAHVIVFPEGANDVFVKEGSYFRSEFTDESSRTIKCKMNRLK